MTDIVVPCDLDLNSVTETLAGLRQSVSAAGSGTITLDLDGPAPTVPALQLLLAAASALVGAGAAVSPGAHAAPHLAAVVEEPVT